MKDTRPRLPSPKKLASFEPGMLHWEVVDPVWDLADNDGDEFVVAFGRVHEAQGLLMSAQWCKTEVCNGGFHQFFLNGTGVLAPEAVRGFTMLEMRAAARLTTEAVSKFGARYPRDRDVRVETLDRLTAAFKSRTTWNPFETIGDAFFELAEIEHFDEYASAFVRKNLSLFFR